MGGNEGREMTVSTSSSYDLVIIVGGAAAFAAATKADGLGRTALMINSGLPIGGTCVNIGCMRTKSLLAMGDQLYYGPSSQFDALRNGHEHPFDLATAVAEKDEIVASARRNDYINVVDALEGVSYPEGRAKFISPNQI